MLCSDTIWKLYADNIFDTETSDNVRENKTSIIIYEIDDKVIAGTITSCWNCPSCFAASWYHISRGLVMEAITIIIAP